MKEKYFCILKNEVKDSHTEWENACKKFNYKYKIVELVSDNWYEDIINANYDFVLLRPPGNISEYKQMYDERLFIISNIMNLRTYPSFDEVILHENKKMLSYWLKAKNIPHIETHVFYDKNEAIDFSRSYTYPIVAKTSIGSSGEGVTFLNDVNSALEYIERAFACGIGRKTGPSLRQGNYFKRGFKWLKEPNYALKKIRGYKEAAKENQRFFVLFQKYIPHDYEWRSVRIGDSYFAHKKTKSGMMCSGSKGIEYVNPPLPLLDFTRKICVENNFNCMSIDIMEDINGNYLVNELQCMFGHVQDHILEVNGKPGRYKYENNEWVFEEGNFNTNLSFDLRLENVIQLIG